MQRQKAVGVGKTMGTGMAQLPPISPSAHVDHLPRVRPRILLHFVRLSINFTTPPLCLAQHRNASQNLHVATSSDRADSVSSLSTRGVHRPSQLDGLRMGEWHKLLVCDSLR